MRYALVLGIVCIVLLGATAVLAAPTSPSSLSVISSGSRQLPASSNGSVAAQGGNVTQMNIDGLSITNAWQGYHGNITGNIHLDDANNNSFYIWGNATPSGEVYASRNATIQWATINCTNSTERSSEETYLGKAVTDGDSVMNTFNRTTHPQFYVGSQNILADTCYSTNIMVNGSQQTTDFYQILLSDDSSNIVYTTIVEPDTHGYSSQVVDFQLIVGENEQIGSEGPTSYFFFVELS